MAMTWGSHGDHQQKRRLILTDPSSLVLVLVAALGIAAVLYVTFDMDGLLKAMASH